MPQYLFSEVAARNVKPQDAHHAITNLLAANQDACYIAMEGYLMGTSGTGSLHFDHAYAVDTLLKHDAHNGGHLQRLMQQDKGLTRIKLWRCLNQVLVRAGFAMDAGRLVGLAELSQEPQKDMFA